MQLPNIFGICVNCLIKRLNFGPIGDGDGDGNEALGPGTTATGADEYQEGSQVVGR